MNGFRSAFQAFELRTPGNRYNFIEVLCFGWNPTYDHVSELHPYQLCDLYGLSTSGLIPKRSP